ncbi:hypothetical protein [Microlunatus sp. Y2014]|uniref:hypothetical protein n=1 Tax=Microlunatus sp. Y2014 TaxID=3418488 RepID=UPI003DA732FF
MAKQVRPEGADHADLATALADMQQATETLAALDAARQLRELVERTEWDLVRTARDEGVSWTRLGELYGLTKQGAQQRFRAKTRRTPKD